MTLAAAIPSSIADVVWPALLVELRLLGLVPILTGLVAEWLVLFFGGFGLSWKKAVVVDVVMNTVSSIAGIVLIPLLGLAWEFFPGILIQKAFSLGTFNPITWVGTFIIAVAATTAIESAVVRWGFKIPLCQRRFWILFGANAVSVGFAFAGLWLHPPAL